MTQLRRDDDQLAERFEAHRDRLRAVAYRMLGSLAEAEDAVQEAWLRLSRHGADGIENLGGWLTTVVARECLHILRSRRSKPAEPLDPSESDPAGLDGGVGPEQEAVLAESVGLAMLVVLDRLTPTERLAFVLHDMFSVPFEEIGEVSGTSTAAARQQASRARRRVAGTSTVPEADLALQRQVVDAYLYAARDGNFDALISLLHPDVVFRVDAAITANRQPLVLRGARTVARRSRLPAERAQVTRLALVDGSPGLVMAPGGRLDMALAFTIVDGKVTHVDLIADPARLPDVDIAVLRA